MKFPTILLAYFVMCQSSRVTGRTWELENSILESRKGREVLEEIVQRSVGNDCPFPRNEGLGVNQTPFPRNGDKTYPFICIDVMDDNGDCLLPDLMMDREDCISMLGQDVYDSRLAQQKQLEINRASAKDRLKHIDQEKGMRSRCPNKVKTGKQYPDFCYDVMDRNGNCLFRKAFLDKETCIMVYGQHYYDKRKERQLENKRARARVISH